MVRIISVDAERREDLMKRFFSGLIVTLAAYLIGCINPAFLLGKKNGIDIREHGTGNAGASNAALLLGKKAGVRVMLFDILKAYVSVKLAARLFPRLLLAGELAGTGCAVGHMYPVTMDHRGGKGSSCICGVYLALRPRYVPVILALGFLMVLLLGWLTMIPLTACVSLPVVYMLGGGSLPGLGLMLLFSTLMLLRHRENFALMRSGEEGKLSDLFRKEGEPDALDAHRKRKSGEEKDKTEK